MTTTNKSPIFITGLQRSGTTLLRLVINRLEDIYMPFESDFLKVAKKHKESGSELKVAAIIQDLMDEPLSRKAEFKEPPEELLTGIDNISESIALFYSYNASLVGKTRWGIKIPGYIDKIHELVSFFPDSKIILLIRDPRDIFLSQKKISWGARDPVKFAYQWLIASKCISLIEGLASSQAKVIKYEDLITDFDHTILAICKFIDEPVTDSIYNFDSANNEMPSDSMEWHKNSIKKPDINKVGEWKGSLDNFNANIITNICANDLIKFGYDSEEIKTTLFEKLFGKVKMFIGLNTK